MKIPRFQSSGLPGAEQQSVGAIVSAGRAKMYGGMNALNKVVDEFGQRILQEEQEAEYHRLSRDLSNKATAMTEGIFERGHVNEQGDPTHGTMEADFKTGFDSLRKGMMDRIQHRGNEAALTKEFDRLQDGYSSKVRSEVRTRSVALLKVGDLEHLDSLMGDTKTGLQQAEQFFKKAELTQRYSATDLYAMQDKFERNWFNNKVMTEFQGAMDMGLEHAQTYADSVPYPGDFTQEEINRLDNHMKGYIDRELNQIERDKNEAAREAAKADNAAWGHASPLVSTALTGQVLTGDALDKIQAYIDNPDSDDLRVDEAKKALAVNQETSVLFSMTNDARQARVVELMSQPLDSAEQRVIRDLGRRCPGPLLRVPVLRICICLFI